MHKGRGHWLSIGVSPTGVALLHGSGWLRKSVKLFADECSHDRLAPDQIALHLRQALSAIPCARWPATVILDDAWTRLFMVTPARNTMRLQDCRAAAAMRFQTLYGQSPADWRIQAHWDGRHSFVACAIPASLDTLLQQIAREYRITFTSIVPHFIAAWNRWQRRLGTNDWFGSIHQKTLTLGAVAQQRLRALRTLPLPTDCWHRTDCLPGLLSREALRLDLSPPSHLRLCGDIPGDWVSQSMGQLTWSRLEMPPHPPPRSAAAMLAYLGADR